MNEIVDGVRILNLAAAAAGPRCWSGSVNVTLQEERMEPADVDLESEPEEGTAPVGEQDTADDSVAVASDEPQSPIEALPDDLLVEIFRRLSYNTLINIAPVSKRWAELTKCRSLWAHCDLLFNNHKGCNSFIRMVRAARYIRTIDVSEICVGKGSKFSDALLTGVQEVRRFRCFAVAPPSVVVKLLRRYQPYLEELDIRLSDERVSYGDDGFNFRKTMGPRPGALLGTIGGMHRLRVLRLCGHPRYQAKWNPRWYFQELESDALKLEGLTICMQNPRKDLVKNFIVPLIDSKASCLKDLYLSPDIWQEAKVREAVKSLTKLESVLGLTLTSLAHLEKLPATQFVDIMLRYEDDYICATETVETMDGLEEVVELSLRLRDNRLVDRAHDSDSEAESRLEPFMRALGRRCKNLRGLYLDRTGENTCFLQAMHKGGMLAAFLESVPTLQEVHIADDMRQGRYLSKIGKIVRHWLPHLMMRGCVTNRLGVSGILLSVYCVHETPIIHTRTIRQLN